MVYKWCQLNTLEGFFKYKIWISIQAAQIIIVIKDYGKHTLSSNLSFMFFALQLYWNVENSNFNSKAITEKFGDLWDDSGEKIVEIIYLGSFSQPINDSFVLPVSQNKLVIFGKFYSVFTSRELEQETLNLKQANKTMSFINFGTHFLLQSKRILSLC